MTSAVDVAPDYAEPLSAWRVVERGDRVVLASVVKAVVWPVGRTLVAECLYVPLWLPWRKRHAAPLDSCACGIYGSSLEGVVEYASDSVPRNTIGWAVGVVSLWGTVVECSGCRGSRTRRFARAEVALQLTEYGVPVRLLDGRAHEVAELLRYQTAAQTSR